MTPEHGYQLAQFQRPGVVIVMGAENARERLVRPLSQSKIQALPGDHSFWERDMRARLGFVPSLFAHRFAAAAELLGHSATDEEWRWLDGPASLKDARAWLSAVLEDRNPSPN